MEEPSGAARGDWRALAWVSAGVLLNASLITTIGFILSCSLCFALAVRGLRASEGKPVGDVRQTLKDAVIGIADRGPGVLALHQTARGEPAGHHGLGLDLTAKAATP